MIDSRPPLSAYIISPIDPSSSTDVSSIVTMLNKTFDGESSQFQRAYYVDPFPTRDQRETSFKRRLVHGMTKQGKKGWKVKLEEEVVGMMIWQPPGVRYHLFDTSNNTADSSESILPTPNQTGPGELYEFIDPNGWNALVGNMQRARDKIHEGREGCWYLELLAIHPSFQGRGLGALLLNHLLDQIPPHLSAHLESSPEGLRLYRKLGFQVVDQLSEKGRNGALVEAPVLVRWGKGMRDEVGKEVEA